MAKVLFVYPNKEGYPIIPLGISILSSILKNSGHEVQLYDVTFMMSERLDHKAREITDTVEKVAVEKCWGKGDPTNIEAEFIKRIINFNPDLIAFSIVENNYSLAKRLFKIAKETSISKIIVGGIFPTVAPDFFINDENVDMICMGEGEYALQDLALKMDSKNDISCIPNLIVKTNGKIKESSFTRYYDWEPLLYQDWEIFDQRHLLKPFLGRIWRTGFFEMSRGCPFGCSYCVNNIYQEKFKSLGNYHREKPIEYVINEIEYMKERYHLELIFFNDENFMMMRQDRFKRFCGDFVNRINLPFFIQTRAESLLDENKVRMLKESGCITIGIGVETGNEKIRKRLLNKSTPDHIYKKAFDNCVKFKIRTTAYIMIGLPFETEEDISATAGFCSRLNTESIAISIFAPYHGTKLYDICVRHGFIEDRHNEDISVNYSTILDMPQLSKTRLEDLYHEFNSMVYGKNGTYSNAS